MYNWASSPHNFFLLVASFFGLVYAVLVPPFQVPDEVNHFKYAYYLSAGHLSGQQLDNRLGGEIPISISECAATFRPLRFNYQEKLTSARRQAAWQISLRPKQTRFTDFPNVGAYAPTPYIPQIAFFTFVKSMELRPLSLLYGSRIATLFFWIILVFYSIKIIPFKKWLWTLCALLPASIFMHSGASGDVVTNAVAFLLMAVLLRLILEENAYFTKRICLLIFVSAAIIALNKFVYTPILCLVLLIPKRKFTSRKLLIMSLFGFTGILVVLLLLHTSSLFIPYDLYNVDYRDGQTLNSGVAPLEQLQYVLSKPFIFIKNMLVSWMKLAPANLSHYFGKFGWEKNYLPFPVIFSLFILTLMAAFRKEKSTVFIPKYWQFTLLSIALSMSIALTLTLYLQWDKVGASHISGLQGRYFIPVLPLLWLAFPSILSIKDRVFLPCLKVSIILALLIGIWSVGQRYYF